MKLVKIEDKWINPEFVCAVYRIESFTKVELVNSDEPFSFNIPIEKVLQAISGSQEHSIKSNDGKDIYSKGYITSSNLTAKDDAKRYSFCNKNINASLVANNTEATISLCANDGVKNLLLKRDYSTVKDNAKIKKINADNIKSGEIGISFDSNGTAIINAKRIKLNGADLQSQANANEKYLHLAAHISDLQGQMAELQDKLSKLSN